ncbi:MULTISPECIES: nuclear transport factor 2 family protein [unclassified Undibacterium]|uniref:nuclear transport factor 2 family protein n=1 Tax=unclassified Undibacterium TaxID=2630295 RepID=UPI002AC9A9C3|nr:MULTISPECIES: nuclear transport factor 2 family protein [unclassified Undibacterium]MEB0138995.1 nuclear transport factor 2 family protein [Undibacterium sp. CCC2.1]MEB0171910.1 nuclear transport factor 2 family protein [Undibacterium sp. CCC1.1]MEB0175851.1 nuclear transport factor 2 family protein [Undibacterium sp. CCC3.4]MEB0215083.1 nuclear transport factor 2 family protein [Undibacterium sp. 5I2]WPX45053.1 nuclear transport factor 2 family protein [Undibacterium sp. CCC3.4]
MHNLDFTHQDDLARLINFFETLSPATYVDLSSIYTADAYFKDPFNEVVGLDKITHIFQHMFVQVENPRFLVTSSILQEDKAFLCWEFYFHMPRFAREQQCIRGATQVRFTANGRICMHRDYWDAAEELYEKLPLLGSLMRFLKRFANR